MRKGLAGLTPYPLLRRERAGREGFEEPPEDPLLLFSVLYALYVASFVAFNGDVVRELAEQFRALAEKQGTTAPLLTAIV